MLPLTIGEQLSEGNRNFPRNLHSHKSFRKTLKIAQPWSYIGRGMAFSSSDCPPTGVKFPQGSAMTHPESTPKLNYDSNSVEASASGDALPKKLRWFVGFA